MAKMAKMVTCSLDSHPASSPRAVKRERAARAGLFATAASAALAGGMLLLARGYSDVLIGRLLS